MAINYETLRDGGLRYVLLKLKSVLDSLLALKYDVAGGEITGNVKIDGNLTLDIPDEDYDAGIRFTKALDDNLGTILTLTGYANGETSTSYRTLLRNIATPNGNYDAANKQYVDDMCSVPSLHLVDLNPDGSVNLAASTLVYDTIKSNLTNPKRSDYLDVFWENGAGSGTYTWFQAHAVGVSDVNTGNVMFLGQFKYLGLQRWMMFELDSTNTLTTTGLFTWQSIHQKTDDIVGNSTSSEMYPSTKAVYDQFQRKPVVVWKAATVADGILAAGTDITASPTWQLTGLDMTPFSRVKLFIRSGGTGSGTTASVVIEIDLDALNQSDIGGHYIGSEVAQNPNNRNRLFAVSAAVSADKTSVLFMRETSLYGTAATGANDTGRVLYKIVGYYD